MAMLGALWQALMTFFSHLKKKQHTEEVARQTAQQITEATQQATKEAQTTQAERHKADEQVRGTSESERDTKLGKWMRD